ncbi:hypothetical protein ACJX0J_018547, partial [Zea mays]
GKKRLAVHDNHVVEKNRTLLPHGHCQIYAAVAAATCIISTLTTHISITRDS